MTGPTASVLTEIVPDTQARIAVDDPGLREWIRDRYARTEEAFVRLNMITTPTGSAVGADGTSNTITSRVDRTILGRIRGESDAVVVGARTVRAEGHIVPSAARLVIVTTTGDLEGHRFARESLDRVLLVCPSDAVARVQAASPDLEVASVEGVGLDPAAIVTALSARGLRRLVCEGGPTLATAFVESGVIDEICVTIAPALEPAQHPFVHLTRPLESEVAGVLVDDAGFSFLRLRVPPRDSST